MHKFFRNLFISVTILVCGFALYQAKFDVHAFLGTPPAGTIENVSGTFLYGSGIISLSGLTTDVSGGLYDVIMSGNSVTTGPLFINSPTTTGTLTLNATNFITYGYYTLILSGMTFGPGGSSSGNITSASFYIGMFDYVSFYSGLGISLAASGINNNFTGVTYANLTAYSGLYFAKMSGSDELGRITFPISLDLTNSGVQELLQNLGSGDVMNMSQGSIKFSPGATNAMNTGATITMGFGSGCTFVSGIVSSSYFTVLSSTGAVLDANSIMSSIVGVYGGNSGNITFSASHFTEFGFKPHLTAVHIVSNNGTNTAYAKSGDKVTLSFTGSETLSGVTITMKGQTTAPTGSGTIWSGAFTVTGGTANGTMTFTINYSDIYNNTGTTVISTTDSSSVTVDNTLPVLSGAAAVTNLTSQTPSYSFTGSETGTITYSGLCSSATTAAISGLNTFTFSALANGTYSGCQLKVTDYAGNISSPLTIPTFTVNYTAPSGGGGGGGSSTGDEGTGGTTIKKGSGSIVGSTFSVEFNNAYLYAYDIGITTMNTIQKANMTGSLIRAHMAKMMVNYAIKVLNKYPNESTGCNFTDIADQTTELKNFIKRSCQLGLMGVNMTSFDPNGEVTRAQFGTVLSRALYGDKYNGGTPFYLNHLNALKLASIISNTDPALKELRGYVMLMLMRAEQ